MIVIRSNDRYMIVIRSYLTIKIESANLREDILSSIHTHTSADITNWATATENFAKTNASNTFTGVQTINGNLNISNNK